MPVEQPFLPPNDSLADLDSPLDDYHESVDSYNRQSVRRLVREHQLFMEVFRNLVWEQEHRMEVE